jgi:hypothetical protein
VLDRIKANRTHPDIVAFAIPNSAKRSMRMGARMRAEGLLAGVADLCIMLPCGRCAWLEMKSAKGRQTVAQRAFGLRCLRLGHPYGIAYSVDDAVVFLKSAGVLK